MGNPVLIKNAANIPLNAINGDVPDVSGALTSYFQPLTFVIDNKTVVNFQNVETPTSILFQGIIQPFTARQLFMKPEGQRAWSWYTVHAEPSLILQVDDVILYENRQYRIMSRQDFKLYGYVLYEIQTDWRGPGPGT